MYIYLCYLHNGLLYGVALVAKMKAIHSLNNMGFLSLRLI